MADTKYMEKTARDVSLGSDVYQMYISLGGVGDLSRYVNAQTYGAIGDGSTDDTAAIQEAIDAVRATTPYLEQGPTHVNQRKNAVLYIPPGNYIVSDTLWLGVAEDEDYTYGCTNIIGDGAVIIAQTDGKPVMDFTGAYAVSMSGITILGSSTDSPNIGILLARNSSELSASKHSFVNVNTFGEFTLSAIYWYGAEINSWVNCDIQNKVGLCAFYMTSNNVAQGVTSPNCTISTGYQSSYADTFSGCRIRWYGCDDSVDALRANIIIESVSYGPKFYLCYFNPLRTATTPAAIIRVVTGTGLTGAESRCQGISVKGCTFEEGADCIISVEGKLNELEFQDNCLATVDTADIIVTASGELYSAQLQQTRGSSSIAELTVSNSGSFYGVNARLVKRDSSIIASVDEGDMTLDGSTWNVYEIPGSSTYAETVRWAYVKFKGRLDPGATITDGNAHRFIFRGSSTEPLEGDRFTVAPHVAGVYTYGEGLVPVVGGQFEYQGSADFVYARFVLVYTISEPSIT